MKRKINETNDNTVDNKTHSNIKSFIDYPGGDWICSGELAANLSDQTLNHFKLPKNAINILIPGIGFSSLAYDLYLLGYHNITMIDIEQASLQCQINKFQPVNIEIDCTLTDNSKTVRMIISDVLVDDLNLNRFDVIVDKGFMDVFLRQGQSNKVWKKMITLLQTDGIYISFSIFHRKWRRYISAKLFPHAAYSSIEVKRHSTTRPTVMSFSCPGAMIIASQSSVLVKTTSLTDCITNQSIPLINFYKMSVYDFPSDASLV